MKNFIYCILTATTFCFIGCAVEPTKTETSGTTLEAPLVNEADTQTDTPAQSDNFPFADDPAPETKPE